MGPGRRVTLPSPLGYFHGGRGGMVRGQYLLPPSITGAPSCALFGADHVCRRDRVYVTTVMEAAFIFAAGSPCGRGDVYLVEPIGPLVPDPDCNLRGLSFEVERALILRRFKVSANQRRGALEALIANPEKYEAPK